MKTLSSILKLTITIIVYCTVFVAMVLIASNFIQSFINK